MNHALPRGEKMGIKKFGLFFLLGIILVLGFKAFALATLNAAASIHLVMALALVFTFTLPGGCASVFTTLDAGCVDFLIWTQADTDPRTAIQARTFSAAKGWRLVTVVS